jgi:RHH-type rel operon transcriptional repressor/antitoxin RelB
MSLTVRLNDAQERALEQLALETGRTKSYYVKQALDQFLEDRADYLIALAAIEKDDGRHYALDDVRRELGL